MTFCRSLLMLTCLFLVASPSWAQTGDYQVEFSLLKSETPPQKRLLDSATWDKELQSGRHKVLGRGSVAGRSGQDAMTMIGKMVPMTYFDPRASDPQVQYVDVGLKLYCKSRLGPDNSILLEVRMDQRHLAGTGERLEEIDGLAADSTVMLKKGQTAILATSRGVLTSRYLGSAFPEITFGEDTTIFFTVGVK